MRTVLFLLCLCLISGCGSTQETDHGGGIEEVQSLEEAYTLTGIDLEVPDRLQGYALDRIEVSEDRSKVRCGYAGNVYEQAYYTETAGNIYNTCEEEEVVKIGTNSIILYHTKDSYKACLWNSEKYTYYIELEEETNRNEILKIVSRAITID